MTPESFLDLIAVTAADNKLKLREDAFDPGPRLAERDFIYCWDRDDVIQKAICYLREVLQLDIVNGSTRFAGLLATIAGRGCGKSFIVTPP